MPEKKTIAKARRAARKGKAPSTQAGEFVGEEIHHIREGKHGARSAKQAIAIGLSKARRARVNLRPPRKGKVGEKTRREAERAYKRGQKGKTSPRRSQARRSALKRERRDAASRRALSKQARSAARRRTQADRSSAARKASRTRARRKGSARGES